MNKEELIQVFNDTKRTSNTNKDSFKSETTKYSEMDIIVPKKIRVIDSDTVSAAVKYSPKGKTCVLNMASAKTAGGGVEYGEVAQEECLFRCSNLVNTVTQDFYPLKENEALYSKNVMFFKDVNYEDMESITIDVVTIASVNLNINSTYDEKTETYIDGIVERGNGYWEVMTKKVRLMLSLAAKNEVKYIILGAWGCGVFKNDPYDVSEIFKEVLFYEGYVNLFDGVIFAIINDKNSVADNLSIFKDCFDDK
jgi:uncharacterized protein (TIGR02452 family)